MVCTAMRRGFARGGTMVGNVFLTGRGDLTPELLRHEGRHATQWAIFGYNFPVLYAIGEVRGPCRNWAEVTAGLRDGGYRC
jgi:hypothetical protein